MILKDTSTGEIYISGTSVAFFFSLFFKMITYLMSTKITNLILKIILKIRFFFTIFIFYINKSHRFLFETELIHGFKISKLLHRDKYGKSLNILQVYIEI